MKLEKGDVIKTSLSDDTVVLDVKDNQAILFTGKQFVIACDIKLNESTGIAEWDNDKYAFDLKDIANMMNNSYEGIKDTLTFMTNYHTEDFTKALISVEKGINDIEALDTIYSDYMDNDSMMLLNDEFDYMIDELRENGLLKDNDSIERESDDLVNITGEIIDVDVVEIATDKWSEIQAVNFTVSSKDDTGKEVQNNCSAFGENTKIPKKLKEGDQVNVFGQVRTSIDDDGKVNTNVRVLNSKLIQAKEKTKEQEERKESVLGAIKKYQAEDKEKPKDKVADKKENER